MGNAMIIYGVESLNSNSRLTVKVKVEFYFVIIIALTQQVVTQGKFAYGQPEILVIGIGSQGNKLKKEVSILRFSCKKIIFFKS